MEEESDDSFVAEIVAFSVFDVLCSFPPSPSIARFLKPESRITEVVWVACVCRVESFLDCPWKLLCLFTRCPTSIQLALVDSAGCDPRRRTGLIEPV